MSKYEKGNYIYRFLVVGALFSSGIKNDANISFITCNGLNDVQGSTINEKIYKLLRVVYFQHITN